jgi:hypothetical protein
MKRVIICLLIGLPILFVSCAGNTYSALRQEEDRLIANYLSRNNINVLEKEPGIDYVWGEKDYYKIPGYDNLYFHLIKRGDSIRLDSINPIRVDTIDMTILRNDVIVTRYKKFGLTENPDTLSYWTTLDQAHPYEFFYGITSGVASGYTQICEAIGWHEAVKLMKYPNSQCQIIVPSKQGFDLDQTSVTPYIYILKIQVKN